MNKQEKTQRGITLIALVITIIVMLILVAVTISMAVNGGLFDYAGKAVSETNNALKVEQQLANGAIQVDGVWYDSIDDYLKGKPAVTTIHRWTRSGDTFTCSHCNTTYTMGQVVGYTEEGENGETVAVGYTATGTSKIYASRLGLTAAEMGAEEAEVTSQNTTWVVLGIQDTNNDNINETLLITTTGPVGAVVDGTVMDVLPMKGAAAYNNGPDEINRICEDLYSNSEYGTARGMTIEDVNDALNYTPHGGEYYDSTDDTWKTTGNLTTTLSGLPEASWNAIKMNTNGTYTPDGTNTEAALGEYEVNGYVYALRSGALVNLVNYTTSEVTITESNLIFGENANYFYWLASRGVGADSDYACFGPGNVYEGSACSYYDLFRSDGVEGNNRAGVRPVVSLTSKLPSVSE